MIFLRIVMLMVISLLVALDKNMRLIDMTEMSYSYKSSHNTVQTRMRIIVDDVTVTEDAVVDTDADTTTKNETYRPSKRSKRKHH